MLESEPMLLNSLGLRLPIRGLDKNVTINMDSFLLLLFLSSLLVEFGSICAMSRSLLVILLLLLFSYCYYYYSICL